MTSLIVDCFHAVDSSTHVCIKAVPIRVMLLVRWQEHCCSVELYEILLLLSSTACFAKKQKSHCKSICFFLLTRKIIIKNEKKSFKSREDIYKRVSYEGEKGNSEVLWNENSPLLEK